MAVFCCFLVLFGVALKVILVSFCEKFSFFWERGDLRFLDTFKTFWLDFEGLGHPESMLKQEKRSTEIRVLLVVEKTPPESFLSDFGLDFEVILEPRATPKREN